MESVLLASSLILVVLLVLSMPMSIRLAVPAFGRDRLPKRLLRRLDRLDRRIDETDGQTDGRNRLPLGTMALLAAGGG